MKKLKAAIAVLIIVPLLIIADNIYLNRLSVKMTSIIDQAEQYERDSDTVKAKQTLQVFSEKWENHKHLLATFIRHSELDIANQSESKLKSLADSDDKSEFYAECDTLKMQINHIAETEKFCLDNIL